MARGIVFICVCLAALLAVVWGYGEPTNGSPNWQERTSLSLLNAARLSPSAYATNYLSGFFASPDGTLTTAGVSPMYIDAGLTNAAEYHSQDLNTNCPGTLQSNDCNGGDWFTTITSRYTCSNGGASLTQLLFGGSTDPLYTLNYLLCLPQQVSSGVYACCADSDTSCNSLRNAALSTSWVAGGVGFAGTTWTWDLSSCPQTVNGIVSGSHVFMPNGNIRFIAQWVDTSGASPSSAQLNLFTTDWSAINLALDGGSPSSGNYAYETAKTGSCSYYYYTFVGGNGATVRYPTTGYFATNADGSCTTDYTDSNPTSSAEAPSAPTGLVTGTITNNSIAVSWTAPANGGSAITDYTVYYRASSDASFTTADAGVSTTYTMTGLSASTSYFITVSATNAIGTSPQASQIAVSTAADPSANSNNYNDVEYNSRTQSGCSGIGIYNQASCGSCYSFATAAAASDRQCRFAGNTVAVSPQDILDCGFNDPYNVFTVEGGCNGGYMLNAGKLMCERPIASGSDVSLTGGCRPYRCANGCDASNIPTCSLTCDDGSAYTTTGCVSYDALPADNEVIKQDIFAHGPVVVGIYVCQSFYDWFDANPGYNTYTTECSPSSSDYVGGHAVTIVGWWNDANGVASWILANSWGSDWGNWNGYFSLPFNSNGMDDFGYSAANHGWPVPGSTRAVETRQKKHPPVGRPEPVSPGDGGGGGGIIKAAAQLGLDNWWYDFLTDLLSRRNIREVFPEFAEQNFWETRQATPVGEVVSTANPYSITSISDATTQPIAGQKIALNLEATNAAGSKVSLNVAITSSVTGAVTVASTSVAGAGGAGGLSTGALIGIIVGSVVGGLLLIAFLTVLLVAAVVVVYKIATRERTEDVNEEPVEMEAPQKRRGTFAGLPRWYEKRDRHNSITARSPASVVSKEALAGA